MFFSPSRETKTKIVTKTKQVSLEQVRSQEICQQEFRALSDSLSVWRLWRYFHPGSHLLCECQRQPVKSASVRHPVCTVLPWHTHIHVTTHTLFPHRLQQVCIFVTEVRCDFFLSLPLSLKDRLLTFGAPLPAQHLQAELFMPNINIYTHPHTHTFVHKVIALHPYFFCCSHQRLWTGGRKSV